MTDIADVLALVEQLAAEHQVTLEVEQWGKWGDGNHASRVAWRGACSCGWREDEFNPTPDGCRPDWHLSRVFDAACSMAYALPGLHTIDL